MPVPIREQVSDIDLEAAVNTWLSGYVDESRRRTVAKVLQNFLMSIDVTARITEDGYLQIVRAYNVHILFEGITAFEENDAKRKAVDLITGVPPANVNVIVEGVTPS